MKKGQKSAQSPKALRSPETAKSVKSAKSPAKSAKKSQKKSKTPASPALAVFLRIYQTILITVISPIIGFYLVAGYMLSKATISLELHGGETVIMEKNEPFVDPGFSAVYCLFSRCYDLKDRVKIDNPDAEKIAELIPGAYQLSYSLDYQRWHLSADRIVKIPDATPPDLNLNGDDKIGMYVGEKYIEPGFSASDAVDGDLTEKVEIDGSVDPNRSGVYTLTYRIADASGNSTEKTRHVFVYEWYALNSTPTATFEDLNAYLNNLGLNVSFGFYRFDDSYEFTVNPDKVYYGASLVKTLDALYAYEKTTPNYYTKSLLRQAISYSNNSAHTSLVRQYGIETLKSYAREIGMTHHLTPSEIYSDTYYFCDTTVTDQLAEWKHLWHLIETLPNGGELRNYFINNYWPNLRFNGSPTFMYKNGDYGIWYHEVGIIYAERPYLVVMLSTHRQDWRYLRITEDFSHRIYLINQILK